MSPIRDEECGSPTLRAADAITKSQSGQTVVPYDENLLERTRIQWQFGDWHSLAMASRDSLQNHPDRARLALLAAAGQMQVGSQEVAVQLIRLAQDWGCSRQLVMRILAAGVHNSLGRALAQAGHTEGAFAHFEKSIRLGAPTSDTRLITDARAREQLGQLGLTPRDNQLGKHYEEKAGADVFIEFAHDNNYPGSPIPIELFFSDSGTDRQKSLAELKKSVAQSSATRNVPEVSWVSVGHRDKTFFFAHFAGDYIPGRMAEKHLFYEAPFLNLLARLYQPGNLIIDGGANIGNHSVFFAGVMGAPVIAFEPQPYNFTFLLANAYLNSLQQKINVRRTAIGDRAGRLTLAQAISNNYGTFTADRASVRVNRSADDDGPEFEVDVSTLDQELVNFRKKISIIKLDLEGMELSALLGARRIITESMPVIAVECFTKSIYQSVKNFLATFDYFVIDSSNATPTFIFLSRKNPTHQEKLSKYLEMTSVGRFSSSKSFNESGE